MTPLYDIMSAQPAVDAGQIRHNKMKLALAIGANNHYVVDRIMPRHFIQTGEAGGMPAVLTQEIMAELLAQTPKALEQVQRELPAGFPQRILTSIGNGFLRRAKRLRENKSS